MMDDGIGGWIGEQTGEWTGNGWMMGCIVGGKV